MRCLTLAEELKTRGAETLFVSTAMADHLREKIERNGHTIHMILGSSELVREELNWEMTPLEPDFQRDDAAQTIQALSGQADWIVADHYLLDRHWQEALRSGSRRIMVIDDLANRFHDCDLLLDQTFGRSAGDYSPLVSREARLLLGSRYALLRPEFERERPASLTRRRSGGPVRNILISLGTTDWGGVTAEVTKTVLDAAPECVFNVVLTGEAPSLDILTRMARKQPSIRLHVDAADMALLMRDADLAIGASGTTSWERCCLGLPTIALVLAENQRLVAHSLAEAGACITSGLNDLATRLRELLDNRYARVAMVAAAAGITSGNGASLVAAAMLDVKDQSAPHCHSIRIRPAAEADAESLWLWRNDPATRRGSQNSSPVPWPDHVRWLEHVLACQDAGIFMAERNGALLGMVRFDRLSGDEEAYEVSINIAPNARGGGVGREVLALVCGGFLQQKGPVRLEARVHEENLASRRIFEALGFRYSHAMGEGGFHYYVRPKALILEP
jgi:UDP-2,4-diacetamido-2,4,6-trideoxy-beta-L-altropyranose hydrolase